MTGLSITKFLEDTTPFVTEKVPVILSNGMPSLVKSIFPCNNIGRFSSMTIFGTTVPF